MRYSRHLYLTLVSIALLTIATSSALAAALPRLPTELVGRQALAVRPPVVDFTGDGTGFLGGFTGRRFVAYPYSRTTSRWLGRLHWTSWTAADARGYGAIWLNNGVPDDARGTFYPHAVTVRAFRPRNGIFTRLAFMYWIGDWPYATVRDAHPYPATQYGPGYWQWF